MTRFYNPYHFVPLKAPASQHRQNYDRIAQGKTPFIRHDRWEKDAFSGRIECKLKTISPLVVGAQQQQGDKNSNTPGRVTPYRNGQYLPANSLRGMIASVTEIISNSALRVLSKRDSHEYAVRKTPEQALKKMGLLLKKNSQWKIYPLGQQFKRVARDLTAGHQTYQHQKHSKLLQTTTRNSWVTDISTGATRGILYIRGYHPDMPNKKHETFIPWNGQIDESELLDVDEGLVAAFNAQLVQRHEALPEFPHLPVGYNRDWRGESPQLVRDGDLLYYEQDNEKVTELSYSAIWRKPVGNLYDAIESIDANLLPWNPDRQQLTPAEALFGVIEKAADGREMNDSARNLASRLRFHDAKAVSKIELMIQHTLKILDSPKPPSTALYFFQNDDRCPGKADFHLHNATPQGRKRYLPHPNWRQKRNDKHYWETIDDTPCDENKHNHQKLQVRPIPAEKTFIFRIDFDNLSAAELTLLRRAIEPGIGFQHQLGLGKPLGLGQVAVTIEKIELIDRHKRYSWAGSQAPRYDANKKIKDDNRLIDSSSLDVLNHLGRPGSLADPEMPVCYPFSEEAQQSPYNESEGFKWFGENDKSNQRQCLKPIDPANKLPTLDSNTTTPDTSTLPDNRHSTTASTADATSSELHTLKIGGFTQESKKTLDYATILSALTDQFPELKNPQRRDPGKNFITVEISATELEKLFATEPYLQFTVGNFQLNISRPKK